MKHPRPSLVVALLSLVSLASCSESPAPTETDTSPPSSGGAAHEDTLATGGAGSNGSTGGNATTGGSTASNAGGANEASGGAATGGAVTGGAANTGGSDAAGGSPSPEPTGGNSASGGADATGGADAGPRTPFTNPLNTSHGSDPWMTYYDGYYYLAATTWGTTLTMKRGRTIAELKAATPSVIWQDTTTSRCCNMWAPEFHLIDGPSGLRWYHYYTAGDGADLGTQRSYVLESTGTDPRGPYQYRGQLLNYWAIDGSVFSHNNKRYFLFSTWENDTQNVYAILMSSPWAVTGNRTRLTSPTFAWEQEGTDSVNEGPVVLQHDGRTFLTYSASQCADAGYKLGMLELTGADVLAAGAWTKSSTPVFQGAGSAYGAGHNGFFISPDGTENWLVYHATSNANGSCWTDRTTRIQPFTWNANGTPNFGAPLPFATEILSPSGE